jgi:2-octaprenyl-3-methyl-6-methoxy-1,4-benzoquinol hydroxylase
MSTREVFDVAVVGGGVVGGAAALALARDGWSVALVEPRLPPRWGADDADLRVYAIAPDAMGLLDSVGIGGAVREARVQPYRRMEVWDAGGTGRLDFDADRFGRRELGWIVEHALLVDRMWQALPQAGVQVHASAAVEAREPGEAHDVLRLDDGRRLRARLVVAADGAASPLRAMAGIEAPTHDYGQCGLVAYVETAEPHRDTAYQRFLPDGPLAFLPFVGGRSSIVWSQPAALAQARVGLPADRFEAELATAFEGRLGDVRLASRRVAFPLRRRLAASMLDGRLALVGDAAHAVHPLAGQGVNLGLRDVIALRAALAPSAARGGDPAQARLSRWARTRRSENARAAYAFEAINRAFSNDAVLPVLLRGPLLGLAGRLPPLQHLLWREAAGL